MTQVLIVDDHEIVRCGLRAILMGNLQEVVIRESDNAGDAINHLITQRWDLVLLDINLPGRSGLEVLEEARRLCPQTPVLVLTCYGEEHFALRVFKLGAAGYVSKQEASSQLIHAVRHVLDGGKYVPPASAERLATCLSSPDSRRAHDALSQRELQVLRLIAMGKATKEIANELKLSGKTIATYRDRIGAKTGLNSGVEIARYALKCGLVD